MVVLVAGCYRVDAIANVLFVVQAIVTCCLWHFFVYGAIFLAFMLIVHHILIHYHDDFSDQYTFLTLQLNDVSNHETWIVASVTAAVVASVCP